MIIDLLIIVEGISDLEFIRDFILVNFEKSTILNANDTKILIVYNKKNIEMRICRKKDDNKSTGGKGNLIHIKDNIKSELEDEIVKKVTVIFDADKDFEKSNNEITSLIDEDFKFELFLMPNHTGKAIGDLEKLILENCLVKTEFNECFDNFKACLSDKKFDIDCLDFKTRLYNYFEVNNQNPKLDKRDYKSIAFNLKKDSKGNAKFELYDFINNSL